MSYVPSRQEMEALIKQVRRYIDHGATNGELSEEIAHLVMPRQASLKPITFPFIDEGWELWPNVPLEKGGFCRVVNLLSVTALAKIEFESVDPVRCTIYFSPRPRVWKSFELRQSQQHYDRPEPGARPLNGFKEDPDNLLF